jgi:hypothetical protein
VGVDVWTGSDLRRLSPVPVDNLSSRCPLVFLATPNVYFLQAGSFHNSHPKDFTLSAQALPPPP